MFLEIEIALIKFLARRERNRLIQKKAINKRSFLKHHAEILKRANEKRAKNVEAARAAGSATYRRNRAKLGLTVKSIRKRGERTPEICREESRKATARFQKEHPERCAAASAKWYKKAKHRLEKVWRERASNYRRKNPKHHQEYCKARAAVDPVFNVAMKTRRRLRSAISRARVKKPDKTINILGCSYNELKAHIENQFTAGMTWEKVMSGEIHLDHKLPIASFDLSDDTQLRKAFHFSNMQPLWAADNLRKGDKILPEFAASFPLANVAACN